MSWKKKVNKETIMGSTYKRSFLKGIVWEFISFIITTLAVFIFYGDIVISVKFSLVLSLIKMIFFFIHERCWKMISWGHIGEK
jgi:uncharacterized membrane protein